MITTVKLINLILNTVTMFFVSVINTPEIYSHQISSLYTVH